MKKNMVKMLLVVMMVISLITVSVCAVDEPPDPKSIKPIVEVM
jgi:hypothetical protein